MTQTEVGARDIKESRRRRSIPIAPGGHVGDYVPFHFAPRSPMMYRIACEHRDLTADRYQDGDKPLIYLVTTVGAVTGSDLGWVATEFTADLDTLENMVDWPLLDAERWNNTPEDPDRQRRRQAEFLVYQSLPLTFVRWIGVHNPEVRSQVDKLVVDHALAQRVIVRPRWYYGYGRG